MPYCGIMFCFMLNTIKVMCAARVELTYSFNSLDDLKLSLSAVPHCDWFSAVLRGKLHDSKCQLGRGYLFVLSLMPL